MKHGSLFSGIGGFDLAAQWMGWENVFHCELKEFNREVLKYYWPNAASHTDIRDTDFSVYRGRVDIITGGFPCQPFSVAGLRKGKNDNRHLWPEMLRAIKEVQPDWVVGENVRGIVNWSRGMVFDEVCRDLESCGYEVTPVEIPAVSLGFDHIRERVWFIANTSRLGWTNIQSDAQGSRRARSDAQGTGTPSEWRLEEADDLDPSRNTFLRFQEMHGQPAVFDVDDGLPFELDGITVSKWIEETCSAGGNAIVPQVAFEIFKAIEIIRKQGIVNH